MLKHLLAVFAFALLLHSSAAIAGDSVGKVREVGGDVKITRAGANESHYLNGGDALMQDDTIVTGKDSHVKLDFADGSEVVLAQNGKLVIDQYVYDANKPEDNKSHLTILDTAFSFVGGAMDKTDKPDVKLNLNFGSIGVRGTKLMRAMKDGECWIYLQKGKIDVYNPGGLVTLAPGEGTIMKDKKISPQKPHVWTPQEIKWIKSAVSGGDAAWRQ